LVESDRNKRARWAAVTLPQDAPIPIAEDVGEGLGELTLETEERVYQHLGAVTSNDPLVLSGQIVGLMCASECLLALFPSNKVAAFCVQLASMSAAADAWIARQDDHPEMIELTAECGTYAWVEWNHRGEPERNELLVGLDGPEPVRVAKFKRDPIDGPIRSQDHVYDGAFFQHGDVTVGFVIRGKNLLVIANDKVAQSHGEIALRAPLERAQPGSDRRQRHDHAPDTDRPREDRSSGSRSCRSASASSSGR
jgi:hypothetical protein